MRLRMYSAEDVRRVVGMDRAVESMKDVFRRLSSGRALIPLRASLPVGGEDGVALFMPASLGGRAADEAEGGGGIGTKVISIVPSNRAAGVPTIHALVVILDERTGAPRAVLEGTSLTALRTGAASGAATDALARAGAEGAAIFGAGVQARAQLEGICAVRGIRRVRVYDVDRRAAEAFAEDMGARGGRVPRDVRAATTPEEALDGADVVCAATTSKTPVFPDGALGRGAHVNAVGSFRPDAREVPGETVARAVVVVDSREACREEAGDLIMAEREGRFDMARVRGEIGEVLLGLVPGRGGDDEVTLFKSVGLAAQDLAVARMVADEGPRLGLGLDIDL